MDRVATISLILSKLNHPGAGYRIEGLKDCVVLNIKDIDVINRIKELKKDDVVVLGWRVGQLATIVLDVMGIEQYQGDDSYTIKMIENLPSIFGIVDEDGEKAS